MSCGVYIEASDMLFWEKPPSFISDNTQHKDIKVLEIYHPIIFV